MLFFAVILVLFAAYFVQKRIFKKRAFSELKYHVSLDSSEVTVGDDLYMFEELSNEKILPLPYVKVLTKLPEGLAFRLAVTENGKMRDTFANSIESMFVMKGRQRIKRRWRISCKKRGVYSLGDAVIVLNDLIGFNAISTELLVPKSKFTTVTVLPHSVDLERDFTSTQYFSGDVITNRSLLTDPLLRSGARDYTPLDPMNKINWKLSATHGHLMVNIEDYIQKVQSNIILNMCSHIIERDAEIPANPEFIEYNITVAATLLERLARDNTPARLIVNTPPETIHSDFIAGDDETGSKIMVTPKFTGKSGILDAMRVLARLEMRYSMPLENMLDYILEDPMRFTENGNITLVTSVLDGRTLNFHREMKKHGIEVIFYVTISNRGVAKVPENVKVFYRTYFDSYKVGGL
ncbi:MAG: DUF58 domain-containing protein [Clostridiales bacterium]|nr:DUF58 domain-containing protein [Clostridiales bacterium]